MAPTPSALPLRVGLAGVGRFGQLHAGVLADLPGVELAALADPDPDCLARVADRHGVTARYGDALELIADDSLDAVVLATPDEQHGSQARAALAQGHHLFVEKPLAPSWQDARELQQLAVVAGVTLQTGLILRYEPSHRLLQHQIAAGSFGDLVSIRARRNCSRSSFAAIADRIHTVHRTLIHDIDLMLWLTGSRVTSVMAMEVRQGDHLAPQGCFALLRLANGAVAQLESSWTVPAQAPANVLTDHWQGCIDAELAVVGSQRTARLQGLQTPLQVWGDQGQQHPDLTLWSETGGRVCGALRDQLADFTTCLRRGEPSAVADLSDAVEALRIAEALITAGQLGEVVRLDSGAL
ncbi:MULTISPECIES: Gfo/Idh/MocA family protein [unclassified Cyanobium]|uniref:Gfo/Idh/MocA family protein n=1 Tax=unclassified Cyanobium TaxID=2627006 RepID=UPI0020CF29E6|nr:MULTISPECIES: Gfo/Idh/MocA family oxidoreductase [unclassified Cyanobium]MCP9777881.1 Gfo/Idh/MocA family oxidoreductase [Cyanobium sp. Tous-M-B4]MCP9875620.1 Gfo/Idh/MocA family oxidoreductase [Cyanobium sp. A2C-AMD]